MTMNVHWVVTIALNPSNAEIPKVRSDVKNQELPQPLQQLPPQHQRLQPNVHIFIHNIIHRRQPTLNRIVIDTLLGLIQLPIQDTLNTINDTVHVMSVSKGTIKALALVN